MKINVKVDDTRLFEGMRNADKRLAYAVERALNETAKRIQAAMREKVVGDFTVRQKTFIVRQVAKIEKMNFASARTGRAWVEINVGQRPRLFLSRFEEGGDLPPWVDTVAKGFVPVPVIGGPARPGRGARTPKALKLRNLQFVPTTGRKGGAMIASNRPDLYVVPGVGIFQRAKTAFGSGSRLVYFFRSEMSLDARLEFVKTGRRVAAEYFHAEMAKQVRATLAYQAARRAA